MRTLTEQQPSRERLESLYIPTIVRWTTGFGLRRRAAAQRGSPWNLRCRGGGMRRNNAIRQSILTATCLALLTAGVVAAADVAYTYDEMGRLTRADYTDGRVVVYTYDDNGNLVGRDGTPGSPRPVPRLWAWTRPATTCGSNTRPRNATRRTTRSSSAYCASLIRLPRPSAVSATAARPPTRPRPGTSGSWSQESSPEVTIRAWVRRRRESAFRAVSQRPAPASFRT